MALRKNFAGIDYFRFTAAFMVIAIHVAPFSSWNETLDFLVTYCLARVAVPFFFMVTGYFVLAPYLSSNFRKKNALRRFFVKNTTLYLGVSLLYLPVILYSGKLPKNILVFLKQLFFDGTFYHFFCARISAAWRPDCCLPDPHPKARLPLRALHIPCSAADRRVCYI